MCLQWKTNKAMAVKRRNYKSNSGTGEYILTTTIDTKEGRDVMMNNISNALFRWKYQNARKVKTE